MSKEIIKENIAHCEKRIAELSKERKELEKEKDDLERSIDDSYGDFGDVRMSDGWEKEVWNKEDKLDVVKDKINGNEISTKRHKRALYGMKRSLGE